MMPEIYTIEDVSSLEGNTLKMTFFTIKLDFGVSLINAWGTPVYPGSVIGNHCIKHIFDLAEYLQGSDLSQFQIKAIGHGAQKIFANLNKTGPFSVKR